MRNHHVIESTSRFSCSAMLLAALSTGGWGVAAVAGDHGDHKDHDAKTMNEQIFERSDTDKDGHLSRDEFDMMRAKEDESASQEQSSQGLPATAHQSSAVRGLDDEDADRDGDASAKGMNDANTTGADDSSHSGTYEHDDSSRSSTMDQGGSLRSAPSGTSGFSGSDSYGQ